MGDLMLAFLADGIVDETQSKHKHRQGPDRIEHRDAIRSKRGTSPKLPRVHNAVRINDGIAANAVVAETIGEPDFGSDQEPAVKLEEVPLVGSTDDVVVIEYSFRCSVAVNKGATEVAGIHPAGEAEYRLLEVGLRSQFQWRQQVGEKSSAAGLSASTFDAVAGSREVR